MGRKVKGFFTDQGYFGYIEEEDKYMLFEDESSYYDYIGY